MADDEIVRESGVPIPPLRRKRQSSRTEKLLTLQVGDSLFMPGLVTKNLGDFRRTIRKHWPERQFIARTVEGGVRIWRIEDEPGDTIAEAAE